MNLLTLKLRAQPAGISRAALLKFTWNTKQIRLPYSSINGGENLDIEMWKELDKVPDS